MCCFCIIAESQLYAAWDCELFLCWGANFHIYCEYSLYYNIPPPFIPNPAVIKDSLGLWQRRSEWQLMIFLDRDKQKYLQLLIVWDQWEKRRCDVNLRPRESWFNRVNLKIIDPAHPFPFRLILPHTSLVSREPLWAHAPQIEKQNTPVCYLMKISPIIERK